MADDQLQRSRADIYITSGVPKDLTREEKIALLDRIEAATGGERFDGSFTEALTIAQSPRPEGAPGTGFQPPELTPSQRMGLRPEAEAPVAQETVPTEPQTTLGGLAGAALRGGGQTGVAAGLGGLGGLVTPGVTPGQGALIGAGIERVVTPSMDVLVPAINRALGTDITPGTESWNALMSELGVPAPDTPAERATERIARGVAEGVGTIGAGTGLNIAAGGLPGMTMAPQNLGQRVGQMLAQQPVAEVVGSAGAEAGAAIAEELGAGPLAQLAAALGGGLTAGTIGGKIDDIRRALTTKTPLTTEQQTILDAAEKLGIDIRRSDVQPPTTRGAKAIQEILEGIPFGTGAQRFEQNQQRIAAIKDLMQQYGAGDLGDAATDIASDFWTKRGKDLTKWNNNKLEVLDQFADSPVNTQNTVDLIDTKIAELNELGLDKFRPLVNELTDWKNSLQSTGEAGEEVSQRGLAIIEELRSEFGESFNDPGLAGIKSRGQGIANEVYRSLNEDMGNAIREVGGDAAFNQWKVANRNISNMAEDFSDSSLRRALNAGESTPEAIAGLLFNKDKSTIAKLSDRLTPEGRDRARSAIIEKWAEEATDQGVLSPNKFAAAIADDLTSPTGTKKFAPFFNGEDIRTLEGLQRVMDITADAERVARQSAIPGGLPTAVVPGLGYAAARALGQDPVLGLAAGTSALFGTGQIARALESPRARNLALALANTPRGSAAEMEAVKRLLDVVRTGTPVEATTQMDERARGRARAREAR